jgi:aryl-alcohol dehydrogenase-like predicted oxidoreductase
MTKIWGLGFMRFTSTDHAVESIRYALQFLPTDHKLLIDTAQFYGEFPGENEELLAFTLKFFWNSDHERMIIVTKGGVKDFILETETNDHSLVMSDVDINNTYMNENELLGAFNESKKNLEIVKFPEINWCYCLHRRHPNNEIFTKQLHVLKSLLDNGEIKSVGLSEVSLADLQYAQSICKIDFLESEFSMNVQFLINDGYLNYCQQNNINIIGYCPLERGFWTDDSKPDPNNIIHQVFSMWHNENYCKLQPMLDSVRLFAKNKGILTHQLVLSWILHKGIIPIPGSSHQGRNQSNIDAYKIKLTDNEILELDELTGDMTKLFGIRRYK